MKTLFTILLLALSTLAVEVSLPTEVQKAHSKFIVPIEVDDITGVNAIQIDFTYDPDVIAPMGNAEDGFECHQTTLSAGMSATCSEYPAGTFRIAMYGAYPMFGGGGLLNIPFVGYEGSTPLTVTYKRFATPTGPLVTTAINGHIELQ